ncbi:NAD(P)-dependent dehydrogenase (short-subunit alcohol dehydrogenase family) [Nitrospirillum amazonense]|uniref:NAD(P)-dependent dehydrogenase (Short-subunit alcohol dehydrogenase family) n=1 Tax=Nitrospirillum amazonense TaxID=28077 RepID=A0A560J9V9_9PROT|nr:SDR family oxidoreductase [Nitrospirillum amazonense]TWB18385.1 NAD(P)-dependent dehydrogenase (short-subunit alcohol dehydrogenase family) [Nitrospirillum amazonense]TWB66094.1 NAD(P)-dependent dehydrogenase (short-subunit alcohol dehydrogenase family) [Nitrospirillum amazonense]
MSRICEGRVVVVTGAGNGLGRAYALGLAAEGARVVVNDLGVGTHGESGATEGAAARVVNEIRAAGGQAVANTDDVTDWDASGRIVECALDSFGDLHAVVNNAGFVRDRMFVSCTPDEWDAVLRVHLRGHFCTSRHAVDFWRARQKAGHTVDARIINTTSGAGLQGSIGQSAYSAAKGGIATLTLVQAAELGRYGITANALAPNARTRMTEGAFAAEMNRQEGDLDVYAPENTAPLVAWLCSAQSREVTGQVFELKGGRLWLSQGWTDSVSIDKKARWAADELGPAIQDLLRARMPPKPVYGAG